MRNSPEIELTSPVSLYLWEVGQSPLLSPQEERELFSQKIKGDEAEERLTSQDGHLSLEEKRELQQIIEEGEGAKESLILSNRRLVISVAKKYRGRGVPFLDLIQEGTLGLMKAVDKFDLERGNKFSTYAICWIRLAVCRAAANQGRTIRLPNRKVELLRKIGRAKVALVIELGREPTSKEIAGKLKENPEVIKQMLGQAIPLSLDKKTTEEGNTTLGEIIKDEKASLPSEESEGAILSEELWLRVEELPSRQKQVIELRFGLIDGIPWTLEKIGRRMGVTRECIRQIEATALKKIRYSPQAGELREYLRE